MVENICLKTISYKYLPHKTLRKLLISKYAIKNAIKLWKANKKKSDHILNNAKFSIVGKFFFKSIRKLCFIAAFNN